MRRVRYYVIQALEYVIALMFIQGGVRTLTPESLPTPTGVLGFFTAPWVVVAYAVSWILLGLALLGGKWFKWRKTHGYALMGMYLTCVYVLLLSIAINGVEWGQLTTVTVGAASAGLYLRWKYLWYKK